MRLSSLALLFGAAKLALAQATGAALKEVSEDDYTTFNDQKVPPLLELTDESFEKETKASKFMVVKYFNPYCPHCIDFAPTYQTLYEFYYTSAATKDATEPKATVPFEEAYDIRFATLNCLAYGDVCAEHDIVAYPRTVIFKDGERADMIAGAKSMDQVADAIEAQIEKENPGTRPKKLSLPQPEATEAPGFRRPGAKSSAAKDTKPVKDTKPAKPTVTPNIEGTSVSLTAESFQNLVTMTQDPWFVKFYAPWCHHCQAMAPNWAQLAKEMKGRLNIGEVNCEVESRLCKDVRVKGYPTIHFFKGGERVEYDGLRALGDFLNYAEKTLDIIDGIQDVDAESFAELEKTEDVIFVYFYDQATASEDFAALNRLPLSLIGRAKLVKTDDPALYERFKISTWPRMLVSREGRPTYYTPLTPREMRDTHMVLSWMKSVWLPIVPELTASNAREIMDGKIVVLGILNRENEDNFIQAKHEMKEAATEWMDKQIQTFQLERQNLRDAKQLRLEEAEDRGDQRGVRNAKSIRINMDWSDRKEVAFAWVDGTFWQRWIRTTYGIDSKDGDRVIINDEDNRRYWDESVNGFSITPSRVSILETIPKVTVSPPLIKPKLTISRFEKVFFDIKMAFVEHPYLALGCIAGIGFGIISWYRGRSRMGRGHFKLDDSLPIKEIKDSLLGNNANGKND
ncbi:thioredoxin-like protein [Xylariaceae sp. FL1019]|nr:thioredoxin-like protein [Xylariaceae sp. FL1019]